MFEERRKRKAFEDYRHTQKDEHLDGVNVMDWELDVLRKEAEVADALKKHLIQEWAKYLADPDYSSEHFPEMGRKLQKLIGTSNFRNDVAPSFNEIHTTDALVQEFLPLAHKNLDAWLNEDARANAFKHKRKVKAVMRNLKDFDEIREGIVRQAARHYGLRGFE